jgi:hypothetical protein
LLVACPPSAVVKVTFLVVAVELAARECGVITLKLLKVHAGHLPFDLWFEGWADIILLWSVDIGWPLTSCLLAKLSTPIR